MANIPKSEPRESTRRERIDKMLEKLHTLAADNDTIVRLLHDKLFGASPPREHTPERPSRPGWLGTIENALEITIECLEDTCAVVADISQQIATSMPASVAPPLNIPPGVFGVRRTHEQA